jgi:hypothetical protein
VSTGTEGDTKITINVKIRKIKNDVAVAYLKLLSQNLPWLRQVIIFYQLYYKQ